MITVAFFLISSHMAIEVSGWLYFLTVIQDLTICQRIALDKKPD